MTVEQFEKLPLYAACYPHRKLLPWTAIRIYDGTPLDGDNVMEFTLTYRGPLHTEGNRKTKASPKHSIRKQFHPQLKELWKTQPYLKTLDEYPNMLGEVYAYGGYRFAPLVLEEDGTTCSLDILFLRRDHPGGLITNRGDIDNRLKVLFDALRVPKPKETVGAPTEEEDPFYCLLEDDCLITSIKVTTDRLLEPKLHEGEPENTVMLIIGVTVNGGQP